MSNSDSYDFPEEVLSKLPKLAQKPGVYLMKDNEGKVIYVGKAINLKNRVKTYFSGGDGCYTMSCGCLRRHKKHNYDQL